MIDKFLAEHPFFCSLLEHERRILAHYLELYRCPRNSYLVLPSEQQEVLWIVVRGRLGEYRRQLPAQGECAEDAVGTQGAQSETGEAGEPKEELGSQIDPPTGAPSDSLRSSSQEAASPSSTDAEQQAAKPQRQLVRYFLPGDLVNASALTQELVASNEIVSLEDHTQVICLTAFHLAKLAQQQPRIYRALRPVYDASGYLVSGLPYPVWQQMSEVAPPYTVDMGRQWLQRKPLMHSYHSWCGSIATLVLLLAANIWQIYLLDFAAFPFFNAALAKVALGALSLLLLGFVVLQRYRCEYTLRRSLFHITERGLLGLSSQMKSYPLLSIRRVELIAGPVFTRWLRLGGLRIITHQNEVVQLFPIDRAQKWLERFQAALQEAQKLQLQMQQSRTVRQFHKWHKLQPELIKEINYRNAAQEGRLPRSWRALWLQLGPIVAILGIALYYSLRSPLLRIYLTVPIIALVCAIVYQLLRWTRYTWRLSEDFLFRQDNFLGPQHLQKIAIREIQDVRLEYQHIFSFGTIAIAVSGQVVRIQNLQSPQNIVDEIESLRQSCRNPTARPEGPEAEVATMFDL